MIILTLFSIILLYKMHSSDSKASISIKTFGFLDLVCTWGLIFFSYIIFLFYTVPNSKENTLKILTLKNGIAEFLVIIIPIVLGILSIVHLIKHIIYLKKLKLHIIPTIFNHFIIALTFMIIIPIYYFIKDPHGKFKKWSEEIEEKKAFQNEWYQNQTYQNPTSYTDSLGKTTFYDNHGKISGTAYTDSLGETTYYDENGKITGSSNTDSLGYTTYKEKNKM